MWKQWDNDEAQSALPFFKHRDVILALLVVLVSLAIYLPKMDYPLWDPWEPHYSQVAMEMTQVDTWLTPTYRHSDRWFSKPVILFWFLKPSFAVFGQTEFAARLPIVLIATFGLVMFNFLFGRLFSWRVGLISTLVLATSPQFFFIARQTIFDMPYVVFQTTALGFLLVALFKYPDKLRWMYGFWFFSGLAMLSKGLLAIVIPASVVGSYVVVTWDWAVLKRMRFVRGLIIFFAVAAPWFVYMTSKFGYSYFHSFFIYHHFERMAGMIKKPNNTFDLYVRQIFYATFPWSAFLPFAFVRFLNRKVGENINQNRKQLMTFFCFAMPYIFFSLSSTKFNHYIFPVIPFLALIVAHYIEAKIREPRDVSNATRMEMFLAVFLFGVVAKDLVTNYKYLIHLFIYYYDRALPHSVDPRTAMYVLFIPMGIAMGLPVLLKRFRIYNLALLGAFAIAFSVFCNMWLMPRLSDTMSQKKLWEAYERLAVNDEPVCEYHSWERRSVSYYFNNKSVYLNSRSVKSADKFFKRPGKLFCMVDRNIYSKLRNKVKKESNRDLFIVDSSHPFTYLVATEPLEKEAVSKDTYLLKQRPVLARPFEANWDNKIKMLGWETDKEKYRIGEKITITLYFEVLDAVNEDYSIFIHGDVNFGGGRLNGDHLPTGGHYPTDRWQKGQFIKDTWTGVIPSRVSTGRMDLKIGFFRSNKRLPVVSGPEKEEDAIKIGSVHLTD